MVPPSQGEELCRLGEGGGSGTLGGHGALWPQPAAACSPTALKISEQKWAEREGEIKQRGGWDRVWGVEREKGSKALKTQLQWKWKILFLDAERLMAIL